ncbi:uncharacterized protein LOC116180189 isoform X2 [Photinus pyralis]|uniref:uncharacterized protein LOC116180189 isoform X2 n=1 Tax=Photinus pyralis TaxID=7054 RepID=UPI00126749AD|nr:uncharacterized protein LOC116180189 isoform X2 [Photinus pyralis]
MKIALFVLLLHFYAGVADYEENAFLEARLNFFLSFYTECICATGVDPAEANSWLYMAEYSVDPCAECFLRCMYLKSSVMNPDGTINLHTITNKMPYVNVTAVNECMAGSTSLDLCQRSHEFGSCFIEIALKYYSYHH